MQPCPINNAYCTPAPCANCRRVFCAHEHEKMEDRRAYGSYGQYCSEACRDAKLAAIWEIGKERFAVSRIVLVVEQDYCYLVLNKHKVGGEKPGYGFKILSIWLLSDGKTVKMEPLYCHYPGFAIADHPVTFELFPQLEVALTVYDEYDRSMWTIVGFRVLDGEIAYGVGGSIDVIDLRKAEQ